jgi:hypothetical protein
MTHALRSVDLIFSDKKSTNQHDMVRFFPAPHWRTSDLFSLIADFAGKVRSYSTMEDEQPMQVSRNPSFNTS